MCQIDKKIVNPEHTCRRHEAIVIFFLYQRLVRAPSLVVEVTCRVPNCQSVSVVTAITLPLYTPPAALCSTHTGSLALGEVSNFSLRWLTGLAGK